MSAAFPVHEKDADPSPWGEVARLYRHVCVLRANGRCLEAARVQSTELARALTTLRATTGPDADPDARLRTLFAAEEERVLDARILAELLVPLLSGQLGSPAHSFPQPVPAQAAHAPADPAPRIATPVRPIVTVAPGIADFIDEMLVQDRAAATDRAPRRPS